MGKYLGRWEEIRLRYAGGQFRHSISGGTYPPWVTREVETTGMMNPYSHVHYNTKDKSSILILSLVSTAPIS